MKNPLLIFLLLILHQNSRKFTEIYGNPRPRAACAPCIEFLAAKNTVDREYFKFSTRVVPGKSSNETCRCTGHPVPELCTQLLGRVAIIEW